MKNVLILNGPNLNMLGSREPDVYGSNSLEELTRHLKNKAQQFSFNLEAKQSNSEAELINWIHQAYAEKIDFIMINPAAFTHTSIALRDALKAVSIPFIEIHISNIDAREPFRRHSYFSDIAQGVISGFGIVSYHLALEAIIHHFK